MGWTFTPDEFAHVWRETEVDRHPFPLRILETPRTEHDAEALRRQLAERLPLGGDPDLSACLRILAAPHTRIVVIGGGHTPGSELRLLACAVYDRAVLAVQEPGKRPDFGGGIHLSIGHVGKLGHRIAALLPTAPAGREPARAADSAAVRDTEAVSRNGATSIRRLLLKPHTAEGHIRIEPRLDRDEPPTPVHYTWIDVRDDGRYLIKADDTVRVVPASPDQIAAQLQKRIPAQAR
ncbi:ESX secretion-associated protein EspG [Nocardia puris]|uniref:ESAT-6 protein secretion system EspG family protein n=1 Tax=Nocardia puris TaxID=208602 RepID=A0A366DEE7_9NOCA|nr:ESX secretion-associated protein EspG [Nocardia puris]MBF6212023.1 ESX secretion-associated protein EspG [Nocardia puris]MBF6367049.1 ESX secretion-associated protein EspG [Nocardia puris]MBF6461974.1 ESX secretion-associated protein EspG [Nocardia puris]RBO88431.1 ESAT-6 protein secretion system EspG family protein [Nocardia puris]